MHKETNKSLPIRGPEIRQEGNDRNVERSEMAADYINGADPAPPNGN